MRDLNWIDVKKTLPPCKRGAVLGTPVLVWPRSCGTDGFCYYGRRASTQPNFYRDHARRSDCRSFPNHSSPPPVFVTARLGRRSVVFIEP